MAHLQKIRVLLYREENMWVAQTLEYDFASQGETVSEALQRLKQSILGYLLYCEEQGEVPFEEMEAAPQEFFQKFEAAEFIPRNISLQIQQIPAEIRAAA